MSFIPLHYCAQFISFLKFILLSNSSLPSTFQLFFAVFILYFEVTKGFLLDSKTQISMKPANHRFSLTSVFNFLFALYFTLSVSLNLKHCTQRCMWKMIKNIFHLIKTYCKTSTYVTNLIYLRLFPYFLV